MKVRSLKLERFKRFADYEIDFTHPDSGQPLDLVVLVGENGSGKSTILQAIAMTLGRATWQIRDFNDLTWPGLDIENVSFNYQTSWRIQLHVEFSDDELRATRELFGKNPESPEIPGEVGDKNRVWLEMPDRSGLGYGYALADIVSEPRSYSSLAGNQFLGRYYAYNLLNTSRAIPDMFKRVGSVYWYHDQRTTYNLTPFLKSWSKRPYTNITSNADLRSLFTNWFAADGQPKVRRFREVYEQLFPGKTLSRIGDTFSNEAPPVFFRDEKGIEYELAELSGGESVLMPLLLDFVQWDINNSVILIDEIELHLHPPLQQTLIAMLPKLGENNQFIITTHSDAVFNVVPSTSIRRIDAVAEAVNG